MLLVLATTSATARTVLQFAVFGDTPYSDFERTQLPLMLDDIAQHESAFAIHVGDIKSGHSRCDDAVYLDILGAFQAAPLPLIYVPGDNEWTDCPRPACGGFDAVERLGFLRRTFYRDDRSLGQRPIRLTRQAGYPENVRWEMAGVMFVALNMPGDRNNVNQTEEYGPRNQANLLWLSEAFRQAREKKLRGLLLAIQANPFIEADNEGATKPGFKDFMDRLRNEVAAFDGQVALAHGDTHNVQINRPLTERKTHKPIANFIRIETYGAPFLGWIHGAVDDADPRVFRFDQRPWPHSLPLQ
ncbi:MAG TPA: hypothetical protein VI279_12745 [Rhodocyclaceae bacterium]